MVTVSGCAYPWDVVGDPAFIDRARNVGVAGVTLAAAYHSVRAATPLHPAHRVVDAPYAALYRPVRDSAWAGRRLRPLAPAWTRPDAFDAAARVVDDAGLEVTAWIVLTHNTRLGAAYPDVAVVNCFGDRYPYALCPAHEEVREYAATLTAEAVRDAPVDAVSLEACGQLGVVHAGHHDKTAHAWTVEEERRLSVCCCTACRRAWSTAGGDPAAIVAGLRSGSLDDIVLSTRQRHTDLLRAAVLASTGGLPVTLHGHPDPWMTGPSPGLTPTAAGDVQAVLVPAWSTGSEHLVLQVDGRVCAYVTALGDVDLPGHGRRLVDAGAAGLVLYHLGLASPSQRPAMAVLVEELT